MHTRLGERDRSVIMMLIHVCCLSTEGLPSGQEGRELRSTVRNIILGAASKPVGGERAV